MLSVGIIGAGEIATKVHLPVLSAVPGIRVAYIADASAKAAHDAVENFGGTAITVQGDLAVLPQTDVVLLSTPVGTRRPYYDLLASRGTAVLAEKPMTLTKAEALQLVEKFPPHLLACGFQRRAYANFEAAARCVREGVFGPLRYLRISEGSRTTKTGTDARFYDKWEAGQGGILRDLGSHSLDLAFHVSGATSAQVMEQKFFLDGKIDREVWAKIAFSGGASGPFEGEVFLSWLSDTPNTVEFHFDRCLLSVPTRPADRAQLLGLDRVPLGVEIQAPSPGVTTTFQAFYREWELFLAGVREKKPTVFNASSCLPVIDLVEQLYRRGEAA